MPSIEIIAPAPKYNLSAPSPLSPAGMCYVSSLLSSPLLSLSAASADPSLASATRGPLVDLFAENEKGRLEEVSYYDILGGLPFDCTPEQAKAGYHQACM